MKGGSLTKSGRLKASMSTVVVFVLVPQVRMPKSGDQAIRDESFGELATAIGAALDGAAPRSPT